MEFLLAILLLLLCVITMAYELHVLRRELTRLRQSGEWTGAECTSWFRTLEDAAADLHGQSDALLDELAALRQETKEQQAAVLDALQDGLETLSRKLELLEAEYPAERDSRLSRAMEEGVNNLMRYAAGKTSGVEVGLG